MSFEKDATQIKILVEQDELFKAASPENLDVRHEHARQAKEAEMATRGSMDFCPHCNADLREETIGVTEELQETVYHQLYWDEDHKTWQYGDSDYGNNRHIGFFCNKCNEKIKHIVNFDAEDTI